MTKEQEIRNLKRQITSARMVGDHESVANLEENLEELENETLYNTRNK